MVKKFNMRDCKLFYKNLKYYNPRIYNYLRYIKLLSFKKTISTIR